SVKKAANAIAPPMAALSSADQRCVPAEARTSNGAPSAAVAYTSAEGIRMCSTSIAEIATAEAASTQYAGRAHAELNRQASSTNRIPVPSSNNASRGGMRAPPCPAAAPEHDIGDDRDVV